MTLLTAGRRVDTVHTSTTQQPHDIMVLTKAHATSNAETGRSATILMDYEAGECVVRRWKMFGKEQMPELRTASIAEAHGAVAAHMRGD